MNSLVENAIQAEVARASGVTTIWANQTRQRPPRPFVELYVTRVESQSQTEDLWGDAPTPAPGAELQSTAVEHYEGTVQCRVFSGAVTGDLCARNLGTRLRARLALPSVDSALSSAGVALVSRGALRDATVVLDTEHEGRAVLDLVFRVRHVVSEYNTFVETATVQTDIDGNISDFSVPLVP